MNKNFKPWFHNWLSVFRILIRNKQLNLIRNTAKPCFKKYELMWSFFFFFLFFLSVFPFIFFFGGGSISKYASLDDASLQEYRSHQMFKKMFQHILHISTFQSFKPISDLVNYSLLICFIWTHHQKVGLYSESLLIHFWFNFMWYVYRHLTFDIFVDSEHLLLHLH